MSVVEVKSLQDSLDLINDHSLQIVGSYSVIRQNGNFGASESKKLEVRSVDGASKRIRWRSWGDTGIINYDGHPYIQLGERFYSCHQGKDYHIRYKEKLKRERQQKACDNYVPKIQRQIRTSKKLGCPAQIMVVHIIRFPDFKSNSSSDWCKKQTSKALKDALQQWLEYNGQQVVYDERYYVQLPSPADHKYHPLFTNVQEKPEANTSQLPLAKCERSLVRKECVEMVKDIQNLLYLSEEHHIAKEHLLTAKQHLNVARQTLTTHFPMYNSISLYPAHSQKPIPHKQAKPRKKTSKFHNSKSTINSSYSVTLPLGQKQHSRANRHGKSADMLCTHFRINVHIPGTNPTTKEVTI